MPKNLTREKQRLQDILAESLLRDAIATGQIDPSGKTAEELRTEFARFLVRWRSRGGPLYVSLDHKLDLLVQARLMHKAGQLLIAVLIYATWVEHWLNDLLAKRARTAGMSDARILAMLRETTIAAKTGWLLALLRLPDLNKQHAKQVLKLAELRNGFVHYKSTQFEMDAESPMVRDCRVLLAGFAKTIAYLQRYERIHLYRGRKPRISQLRTR